MYLCQLRFDDPKARHPNFIVLIVGDELALFSEVCQQKFYLSLIHQVFYSDSSHNN